MDSQIIALDKDLSAAIRRLDAVPCDQAALAVVEVEDAILRTPAADMQELAIKARIVLAAFDHAPGDEIDESLDHASRAAIGVMLDLVRIASKPCNARRSY